jgi:2-methylisocitrate lyase-like PEP mutase family enzyme
MGGKAQTSRNEIKKPGNFRIAQPRRFILGKQAIFWREESNFFWSSSMKPLASPPQSNQPAPTQAERARAFRALHQRDGAFIIPNPWDIGTARLLAHLGFEALATTSAGFAFSIGRRDGKVSRDEVMAHIAAIAAATPLPVSADLENGFGDAPETAAETIRLAAAAGAVGGSIEDSTGNSNNPIFAFEHAVERVRAAAQAAHALSFPFTLTARAENYLYGRKDLNDTIKRLQAFQEAGADVLYAPGLVSSEDIAAVVRSVDRPVNVLAGLPGVEHTLPDLAAIGVKRISIGSGLARAAVHATLSAAREMHDQGTFHFAQNIVSLSEVSAMFPK